VIVFLVSTKMEDTIFIPIYQFTPNMDLEQSTLQVKNSMGSFSLWHLRELQSWLLCYKTVILNINETPVNVHKWNTRIRNLLQPEAIPEPHTKAESPLCEECEKKLEFRMQNE